VGVVAEIERDLCRLREEESADGVPVLRTSTMTHLVWAPPAWLAKARATLSGLHDRHPARTIFLVPEPRRRSIHAEVALQTVKLDGSREARAEVVEIRLGREAIAHPVSVVLPLLLTDLPVFCRWRGRPDWKSPQLTDIVGIVDRLVVNSSEWQSLPGDYARLADLFERSAVSDIAFSRTLAWRARLAERWPGIAEVERLRVDGPKADALLLAGWLRSRLDRRVGLTRRAAPEVRRVRVDGEDVTPPVGDAATASDLLSAELDMFGRDPVYEAAVRAAA